MREPDFQICINFAEGQQVNLMLSMSHIPKRLAVEGFACTDQVSVGPGWTAQRLNPFLQALGLDLEADQFRLPLAAEALEEAREALPSGDGPLLLLSPSGQGNDWPAAEWHQLPETIKSRLPALRSMVLPAELSLTKRAALVAMPMSCSAAARCPSAWRSIAAPPWLPSEPRPQIFPSARRSAASAARRSSPRCRAVMC